ncbi:hypothetical protein PRZ48_001615 [Zasmidium cellare]|uniref:Uncharacterized protein n=1 Tax=Zasmidium cellare TaxID=395010 RepID=A0ABR0F394_ZASCE|nr:hypothetical protein PRZ48_001615 [Zasmidium cellare]
MDDIYREAYGQRLREQQAFTPGAKARTSLASGGRPLQQHGGQYPGQEMLQRGFFGRVWDSLVWSFWVSLAVILVLWVLWVLVLRPAWRWVTTLPQRPRVQAIPQQVRDARERTNEAAYDAYLRFRWNWYTDQISFWRQRLCNFLWRDLWKVVGVVFILCLVWRACRGGEPEPPSWEDSEFEAPEWVRGTLEAQQRGDNNWMTLQREKQAALDSMSQDRPIKNKKQKKVPYPGAVPSDDDEDPWHVWVSTSTSTTTQPASTETRTITVYEPRYDQPIPPGITTRWSTIIQTIHDTITERNVETETVHDPTTITIHDEGQKDPSTVTSTFTFTQTLPKIITQLVPTIIANVTPTTIYRIRKETFTSLQTVDIPGTTHTTTIYDDEPKTITVTDTTVLQPVHEEQTGLPKLPVHQRDTGLPMLGDDLEEHEHDHVRTEVKEKTFCKFCKQWHCCQLPY